MGSSAIASPIFDVTGHICGALSISGPTQRFNEKVIEGFKSVVIAGGTEISNNMGYQLSKKRHTNQFDESV
jgi:DNA-binding IclR family transcriptional regulator